MAKPPIVLHSGQTKLGLFTMISMHIQLLLGLALYIIKGWASMLDQPGVMESTVMRFCTFEHLVGTLLALLFGTFGYSLTKRASSDDMKHKRQPAVLRHCIAAYRRERSLALRLWIRDLRLALMMNRGRLIAAVAAAGSPRCAGCGGQMPRAKTAVRRVHLRPASSARTP